MMHNSAPALISSVSATVWPYAPQALLNLRAADPVAAGGSRQALLLDAALDDLHVLAAGAGAGMAVAQFGGDADGLAQLLAWAATAENYDALHIVCHGEPGRLQLGARALDRAALEDPAVQDALRAIGLSLRDGGSVLLYSCNVAQGEQGAAFVADLALALGAPVAAARGLVGAAALGGSWKLEHPSGIAAGLALQWPGYQHVLGTIAQNVTTFDSVANTSYATTGSGGYAPGTVLNAPDLAGTGWDVQAQSTSSTGITFRIEGRPADGSVIDSPTRGSIRVTADDIDYVIFKSNVNGFYFDLTSFDIRNPRDSNFTIQAIDASGALIGTAVPKSMVGVTSAPASAFSRIDLSGNPDFLHIYGFKLSFPTPYDTISTPNTGEAPFFDNIIVANIGVPVFPSSSVLTATISMDSGTPGDFITNVASQTISGTLSTALVSGEFVQVSYNGGANWVTASTFAVGSSTWSTTGSLLSGSNTLMARVSTADGSTTAVSHGYTLDTSAPTAPSAPDLRPADDTGSNTDNITSIDTPIFTGTAEAGSTVTLYDTNGTTVLGTAVATGGNWSITSSTLAPGSHTLTAKAVDTAGNVSPASSSLVVVIDRTAPSAVALSVNSATTSSAAANAAVATLSSTDVTAVTYALATGSAGNDSGNSSFVISGTTLSVGNTPLSAGTYNIYLSATDAAGNVSYLAQTFTVNTVPTVTSIVRAGGDSTVVANNATSISYTVTFSESVTGVDASDFALTLSGTASGTISGVTGSGTTYTVTVNTLTGDGAMRLDLKASGTGIQSGASVAVSGGYTAGAAYTLDHTAPSAPLALDLRTADDTGSSTTDNITSVTTPVFTGTAEAGSTVTLYDTDGTTVLGSAVATGGNWSITSSTLNQGSHTLTVKATDAAGNVSAASSGLVVVVDTTAPSALALSSNTVATANASSGATVATLSATDSNAITYALATGNGVNNADNASFVISGNTLSVGSSQLTPGAYHIYLSATDAAGNVSNLAQTINVVNAPSVSSIVRAGGAGATVANNATSTTFTVTFSESVTGVDASDFTLTATNTASGAITNVTGSGTTYTITVGSLSGDGQLRLDLKSSGTGIQNTGNIAIAGGYTSGASYVLDHTAPAAPSAFDLRTADDSGSSSTDNITSVTTPVFTGTAESGSTVTLYDTDGTTVLGSAVASGGNWSITSSTLSEGSHTLTVKAVDAAGNVSAASSALVVVVDTTAPTGLALSQTTVASGTTGPGATVATLSGSDSNGPLVYALATGDNTNDSGNGNFNLVGNVLSVRGSGLLPGSYNVYLSATDAAGNVSHLAQTINVVDAPSVTSIVRAGGATATVAANAASADFTVTFSQSVTGVDASDFVLTTTGNAGGTVTSVAGSGTTYTVTVGNLTGDGVLRLDLNASGTGIQNASNVAILGGYSSGASYQLDHTAPLAPSSASMTSLTDTGSSPSDGVTSNTTPTFTGTAEANATVRLYDTDGTTVLGSATADGSGNWSITSSTLAEGNHTLTVRQTDRAGNVSPSSSALTVVIDTSAAAPATPALAPVSDSGVAGDGITNVTTPTITGTAEAFAAVTVYATDGVTVLGTGTANSSGAWSIVTSSLTEGSHTLTVRQTDRAGNISSASAGLMLTIDTTPPVAPGAPVLAVASDSGTAGDNITNVSQPVLTGTALANATVRLYDTNGTTVLGTATADGSGNWSITSSTLSVGVHTLSARQFDAAGNVSSAGVSLSLTIEAPPAPPVTPQPPMIDGVPVTQQPVTLPGGGSGTQTVIPIVTNTRTDDTGNSTVADIPLATSNATNLLVAQVQPGFGLTATGGASAAAGDPQQQLIQAIMAATPTHASTDQGHLTGNGVTFLNQLAASVPLLVQTITPTSSSGTTGGTLTLTGTSTTAQHTALVIDTSGLPAGATLQLNAVDFAAIVGAANVVGSTNNQILTGDQGAQQFTVSGANSSNVFSGGGSDTLVFNSGAGLQGGASGSLRMGADIPAAVAATTSVLHGGTGIDTASFSGASSDYTIVRHESYVTVASTAQPQQKAVLINVENLKFSDTTLAVETKESLTAIAGLYRDVLGRQADYLGIDSWARSELAGASLGEIAIGIINSVESQARQAKVFNGDNAHDIELLYQSIFSRPSDAGGLALWVQFMKDGASLEQVATQFVLSEEMQAHKIGVPQWDFSMG